MVFTHILRAIVQLAIHRLDLFHVEINYQLDATEVFIADLIACSTCFAHHYAHHQELKNIIQWLLPVVFRAVVFFKLLVWCGAGVHQHPANWTHNPQSHTRPAT